MVSGSGSRREGCFRSRWLAVVFFLCFLTLHAAAALPDVEMTGFKLIQQTDSGRWEIRAGTAYYDGQGDVILQGVTARMIDDGVESVKVSSEKGRYESGGMILHLEGDVTVASAWGSRFESPNLRWDGARAFMIADGGVQFLREGWKVTGRTVRYTMDSGTATIEGDVLTTLDERSNKR